jgi:hypothetical protein
MPNLLVLNLFQHFSIFYTSFNPISNFNIFYTFSVKPKGKLVILLQCKFNFKYIQMKSKNLITNLFIYMFIFSMTFAITGFDFENSNFENNKKEYLLFLGALIAFGIYFYRIKKENLNNK